MHHNIHTPPLQKLRSPFPNIFQIRRACSTDMYNAQHLLLPIMALALAPLPMSVVMSMTMLMLMLMRMRVRMCHPRILQPKPRDAIPHHAPQPADLLQRLLDAELHIRGQAEHQLRTRTLDQRPRGEEDKNRDDARRERVPAGPAVELREERADDYGDGAEGVGEDVQEYALHVFVVVVVVGVSWRGGRGGGGGGGEGCWRVRGGAVVVGVFVRVVVGMAVRMAVTVTGTIVRVAVRVTVVVAMAVVGVTEGCETYDVDKEAEDADDQKLV